MEPDAVEIRVVEKQRTTPDAYPLSFNALRLACNQSVARELVIRLPRRRVQREERFEQALGERG